MKRKTAYLILNPRSDEGFDKLTAILAVLSAAGWKTSTAINEFGGHTQRLAKKAAGAGHDLVIGYGGDGTLNQVVNGVMAAKRPRCMVGVIPGGTANVWAQEIGVHDDPVKGCLSLVNSQGRKVDLGHVQVESLPRVRGAQNRGREQPLASGGRHHFLLMAGLGMDAAVLRHVSSSLRHKIGETAVAIAAIKELPSQRSFPIEVRAPRAGMKKAVTWKGEALQVIVGNTRRYGNIAKATPKAYIDDGMLDVCVITAGDPLGTVHQIVSVLMHRGPVRGRSKYFRSSRIDISVPASVDLQLDGSRVKRKDLAAPDRGARRQAQEAESGMVTYRFDAMPRAIDVAIPRTYDDALFEKGARNHKASASAKNHSDDHGATERKESADSAPAVTEDIDAQLADGRKVTVIGVAPDPKRKGAYIVAGATPAKNSDKNKPVAVRIDADAMLVGMSSGATLGAVVAKLQEGNVIVVEGKQSKRGVIRAKRIGLVT